MIQKYFSCQLIRYVNCPLLIYWLHNIPETNFISAFNVAWELPWHG
jgi:hypothetical protein